MISFLVNIFGERGCEKETLYIINTYTKRNFKTISYEPNEIKGEHKGNKKSITDVLVMMNDRSVVNIEAQKAKQKEFHKRSHFYNSRIYSILLRIGEYYEKLPMTFMINIIDFNLHKIDKYHTKFILCEEEYREYGMEDIMETHYIDLTIFREKLKEGKTDLNNPEDRITLLFVVETPENLVNGTVYFVTGGVFTK